MEADCAYCGAPMPAQGDQVCNEQGGDPPGTWVCSTEYGLNDADRATLCPACWRGDRDTHSQHVTRGADR